MELFERPQGGERAILVQVLLGPRHLAESESEFRDLVVSAGALPVAMVSTTRPKPDPKFFIGSGKAEEIRELVLVQQAHVVIVDHALTPGQERNLEKLLNCRVLDRAGLILDIFAQRARSYEGKLQVELAQLEHLATRLVRGWTHLERQRGGIGLRGPGETQLELDRRLIGNRIKQLKKRLKDVAKQRLGQRRARQRSEVPSVSLVGYTNAGKSTLFNRLTGADVYTANQLFATLDPTLRRVTLPGAQTLVLADTVGFIRNLPHELIAAFRATLEETINADLLLHVIDASNPVRHDQITQVNQVLRDIGGDSVSQIEVYNKIDLVPGGEARVDRDGQDVIQRVWVSAQSGQGISALLEVLAEFAHRVRRESSPATTERRELNPALAKRGYYRLQLEPLSARFRAMLYAQGVVTNDKALENGGWEVEVIAFPSDVDVWCEIEGCTVLSSSLLPPL